MHWRFSQLAGWVSVLILTTMAFTTTPQEHSVGNAPIQQFSSSQSTLTEAGVYIRAVLFWTPDCDFYRQVVEQDLPPVIETFGQQLQVLYVDTNQPNGDALYQATLQHLEITQPDLPMLIIDKSVLQGTNIAEKLPGLVEDYLKKGGVDWPAIPGLEEWLGALPEVMSKPLGEAQCSECELTAPLASATMTIQVAQRLQVPAEATPEHPVARAVTFWMAGCPHCHEVLDNVLPPIQAKYGEQFQLQLIELVGGQEVVALYELAESMGISKEDVGVPFLIIGEHVLVGSDQIPAELPGLIEQYLAAGGVDYPNSPALAPLLPPQAAKEEICPPSAPCTNTTQTTPKPVMSITEKVPATTTALPSAPVAPVRPNGFTLAVVLMAGMLVALSYSGFVFIKHFRTRTPVGYSSWIDWATLVLILVGLGVAGYLTYVETQAVPAVCGPVGDCNTVQTSSYAYLFGVLPVGLLGLVGYFAILTAWVLKYIRRNRWSNLAALAIFGMAFGGTLFSLYLTYLEPFVIKAVCMWCLTSATIMTLILLLNLKPALQALNEINEKDVLSISEKNLYAKENSS